MADEVEIINVGKDGVASEETLAALLEVVEKLAKSKGMDPSKATKKIKELADETDHLIDIVEDNTKALEDNTEEIERNTDAQRSFGNMLLSTISQAATSLFVFGRELLLGGDRISDFTQHVPFVGSLITPLASILDNTVNDFREISNYGIDFGESLIELRRAAAESGLSFDNFTSIIKDNSESFALFAGSARAGARVFADVSRIVQRDFGPQFSALGMTMEQTAQYTADYLDMQRRLGNVQRYNQNQLAVGTSNYIMMLDRLARITGRQRDEIARSLQDQRQDAVINALLSTLPRTAQEQLQGVLAVTESMGPNFQQAIRDMVATGGAPISDFGRALVQANPELGRLANGLRNGTVSQDEFMEALRRAADGVANRTDAEIRAMATAAAMGNEFARAQLELIQFREIAAGSSDALTEQQQALIRGNQGILDFERRITQLRNEIVGRLIDTGIFQRLESAASGLVDMLTGPEGAAAIGTAVDSIVDFFENFITVLNTEGLHAAILNSFEGLIDAMGDYFFGESAVEQEQEAQAERTSLQSRGEELQLRQQNLETELTQEDISPDRRSQIEQELEVIAIQRQQALDRIGEIDAEIAAGFQDTPGIINEQLAQLIPSIGDGLAAIWDNMGIAVVAGIGAMFVAPMLIRSVGSAIGSGIGSLLSGILSGAGAGAAGAGRGVGAGAAGLGRGVGRGIQGVGQGLGAALRSVALGLATLANPATLVGLGALTLSIMGIGKAVEMAAPGIEAFGSAFRNILEGLAPVIESFAPVLESFSSIISSTLGGVADVVESFAEPIQASFEGISSVISSFGTSVSTVLESISATITSLGDAISAPIIATGDAIQGVINSINEYRTAGVTATTDQIERLANIPGNNLIDAARGIEMMKTALEGFEPGFWEGLGDWFTGGARQDSMIATTTVIQDMARAFADLDPEAVERASSSVSSLSSAFQTFNQATAIEGIGDLAARLIGYQDASSAIISLATSLQDVNGEGLERVVPGIIAISSAIGAFQQLTAISSIGEGVSAILQSYVPLAQTVADVATRLSNIETPENLTTITPAISSVISAIAEFQRLTAISSIGEIVSAVLQSYVPLAQTVADVATRLSNVETPENLTTITPAISSVISAIAEFQRLTAISSVGEGVSAVLQSYVPLSQTVINLITAFSSIDSTENMANVAPAIVAVASAIDQFQSLTAIGSLGEGVSAALNSYSAVTTPLIELINQLRLIDGTQLQNVAPGIEAVSNALTVFKNSTGFEGLGDLVSRWFSDDAMSVGANIKTIADDLVQIDPESLSAASRAIVLMSNAFETFSNAEVDNLNIDRTFVTRLRTLSEIAPGLVETANSLTEIAGIADIRQNLDSINQGFNAEGVRTYATAIEQLVENLTELNEVLSETNDTWTRNNMSAAEVLGNINVTTQGNSEVIEELNRVMNEILVILRQGNEIDRRIERNTASLSGDITDGRISVIR